MPEPVTLMSPAKVNYYLRVTGRRADGYHDLVNVMCRVSLFDEITMTVGGDEISVVTDTPEAPTGPDNIVHRAVRLLSDTVGIKIGVNIGIRKNIPVQSGLGGASSNAATVVARLNEQLGLGLAGRDLIDLGIKIGSDVPFFLFGSPAVAMGKGEILRRFHGIADAWLVIVKPGGGISTKDAYEKIDLLLTEEKKHIIMPKFIGTLESLVGCMRNDFEAVAETLLTDIGDTKRELIRSGALGAMLTGSGSAVFGVFADEASARQAHGLLSTHRGWGIYVAKNLFD